MLADRSRFVGSSLGRRFARDGAIGRLCRSEAMLRSPALPEADEGGRWVLRFGSPPGLERVESEELGRRVFWNPAEGDPSEDVKLKDEVDRGRKDSFDSPRLETSD